MPHTVVVACDNTRHKSQPTKYRSFLAPLLRRLQLQRLAGHPVGRGPRPQQDAALVLPLDAGRRLRAQGEREGNSRALLDGECRGRIGITEL